MGKKQPDTLNNATTIDSSYFYPLLEMPLVRSPATSMSKNFGKEISQPENISNELPKEKPIQFMHKRSKSN